MAAIVQLASASSAEAQDEQNIAAGKALVEASCAQCHAVGRTGDSPHREAPPFRELGQRYPIQDLEEALAEGIVTGHPEMPEFIATPEQIGSIIAYMDSIQVE